jgi:hypothetical protein
MENNNPIKDKIDVAENTPPDNSSDNQKWSLLSDLLLWLSVVWALIAPVIFIHRNFGINGLLYVE